VYGEKLKRRARKTDYVPAGGMLNEEYLNPAREQTTDSASKVHKKLK